MVTETCGGCGTRFAIGLLRCPRCRTVAPSHAGRGADERPPREEAPAAALGAHIEMPFKQLRAAAKARGLTAVGTAEELRARIAEHDAKAGA